MRTVNEFYTPIGHIPREQNIRDIAFLPAIVPDDADSPFEVSPINSYKIDLGPSIKFLRPAPHFLHSWTNRHLFADIRNDGPDWFRLLHYFRLFNFTHNRLLRLIAVPLTHKLGPNGDFAFARDTNTI